VIPIEQLKNIVAREITRQVEHGPAASLPDGSRKAAALAATQDYMRLVAEDIATAILLACEVQGYFVLPGFSRTEDEAILCLTCGAVSHNRNDIEQRYCGRCHRFHGPFTPARA
jgi:hypothetical protein